MPKATYNLEPLVNHVAALSLTDVSMSIDDVEKLTGPLPASAHKHWQWWENGSVTTNRPIRRAMDPLGIKTFYSPTTRRVRFVKAG